MGEASPQPWQNTQAPASHAGVTAAPGVTGPCSVSCASPTDICSTALPSHPGEKTTRGVLKGHSTLLVAIVRVQGK